MQAHLARGMFWLAALTCAGLAVRELWLGGAVHVAAWGSLGCFAIALWSRRRSGATKQLTLLFLFMLVVLITSAAYKLGGAGASALCFSFLPGFVAILVVGPSWGWLVSGLMLACLLALYRAAPLTVRFDQLRFYDEVGVTAWAASLAHALHHSFKAYESAIAKNGNALLSLREQREAMAQAVYEQLEPLSASLEEQFALGEGPDFERARCMGTLERMIEQLRRAKALARPERAPPLGVDDSDRAIRRRAMRLWMRLGAVFMASIVIRNFVLGVSFEPSIFSFVFCVGFDWWLGREASRRHLEATALAIGVAASGPMIVHIHNYGSGADAPALVVTPATVLFTALLSQGPAAWAIVALNCGILAWTALSGPLSQFEARLLGDLVAAFFAIMLSLRGVFTLRSQYARTLLDQTGRVALALRQHRRLAGTLFHDVSNQLQTLAFYLETSDDVDLRMLRSLSGRIKGLIALSKEFLVGSGQTQRVSLESFSIAQAVHALAEAFAPRLQAKRTRFEGDGELELRVLVQPALLVESVLGNLLSNAIKFSEPASLITLSAERVGEEVRLVLRDHGPGLPPAVLRGLEEDEALPSSPGTAGEQGQGYGLQLVREHVGRMGGRLELRNSDDGGTEASVWLHRA